MGMPISLVQHGFLARTGMADRAGSLSIMASDLWDLHGQQYTHHGMLTDAFITVFWSSL